MYIITKILEFLQIRGIIAVAASLMLIGTTIYTNSILKSNKSKDLKIAEYATIVASYKSVLADDTAVAKAQSSECAALVKEQVNLALQAIEVPESDEQFFRVDGLIK